MMGYSISGAQQDMLELNYLEDYTVNAELNRQPGYKTGYKTVVICFDCFSLVRM